MKPTPRRSFIQTAGAMGYGLLTGCGSGDTPDGAGAAAGSPVASPAPALGGGTSSPSGTGFAVPLVPAPTGKYRTTQQYLFQPVSAKVIPSRLPGGSDFGWDIFGPTTEYVDFHSGWRWSRAGGDWIDADQVRYGTRPWFSIPVGQAIGATAKFAYSGDVTAALQFVQTSGRWCAFLLDARNAPRAIAGVFNQEQAAPSIDVTYANGQQASLRCRILASNSSSSIAPSTTNASYSLPVFVEFDRPTAAVTSARLNFVITEHWSGSSPTLDGFLLDPPITADMGPQGVASGTGRLDLGIESNPSVIGAHRYLDGTSLANFVYAGDNNFGVERNYDPAIFGTGPTDLTKFPHVGLGKWVNADPRWSLVDSTYRGEGFAPLAPGIGALRIPMPAEPGIGDASVVGYSGTLAGNGMIFLPEPLFGRLGRIFVRYYVRLGTPYAPTATQRYHVYNSPGAVEWTTMAGKFGIAPDHTTSYGGVSGTAGGGYGWQMRLVWADCDAGMAGPDEGGTAAGFHLYDFTYRNPPGHNYGSDGTSASERWGQIGGAGGVLYAGQWYCIETELKLNSVSDSGSGYTPDGELRAWVDGRMVFERTGMVFRTLPLVSAAYNSEMLRPCRELGVRGLWLNWFHGGKTLASIDRTNFYTGLVWSKDYIGPMNL